MPADPADLIGRDAGHQGKRFDVPVHDGTGGDEGVLADGNAADDGAVGAERGPAFDQGVAIFVLTHHGRAGIVDVGEHHTGAAEDIVLEGDVVIDGDVVLDLAVVADHHLVADEDVLAEAASLADACGGADVDPVPDPAAVADLGAFIDNGGWMDRDAHAGAYFLPRKHTEGHGNREIAVGGDFIIVLGGRNVVKI